MGVSSGFNLPAQDCHSKFQGIAEEPDFELLTGDFYGLSPLVAKLISILQYCINEVDKR